MSVGQRYLCATWLTLLLAIPVAAQLNPVYQAMRRDETSNFKKRLIQIGIDTLRADLFADLGFDDTTVANLRNVGVDLPNLHKKQSWSEKDFAAGSDCIVIGTVARIEHPGGNTPYQTTAYVDAEEFLRNDFNVSKNQIPVMIVSGPTMRVTPEDTLGVGEHVLLFLSARSLMSTARRYQQDYYNRLMNDPMVRFRIIGGGKYLVKSGRFVSRRANRDMNQLRDEVKSVTGILHREVTTN